MVAANTLPTSLPADDVSMYEALWTKDLGREHGFEPLVVEGTLPAGLRGTLYRNGPGKFGQFGTRYKHPFEGDGAATAVRIEGGKATGKHVHISRKYNGEWISADGPLPFVLSGWRAVADQRNYQGSLVKGEKIVSSNPGGIRTSTIVRE